MLGRALTLFVTSLTLSTVGTVHVAQAAAKGASVPAPLRSLSSGLVVAINASESQRVLDGRQATQTELEQSIAALVDHANGSATPTASASTATVMLSGSGATPGTASTGTLSVSTQPVTVTPERIIRRVAYTQSQVQATAPQRQPAGSVTLTAPPTTATQIVATAAQAQGTVELQVTPVVVSESVAPPSGYAPTANGVYVPVQYTASSAQRHNTAASGRLPGSGPALNVAAAWTEVDSDRSTGLFLGPEHSRVPDSRPTAPMTEPGSQPTASPSQFESAPSADSSSGSPVDPNREYPRYPLLSQAPATSLYGMRWGRLHAGVDLGVPVGTPVVASLPGRVVHAGWMDGYGNTVVIRHLDGSIETLYGHLSQFYVQVGQSVAQSQLIAASGSTGYSTGPHLHFEMRQQTAGQWHAVDINQIVATAAQQLNAPHTATALVQSRPVDAIAGPEIRVGLSTQARSVQVTASATAYLTTGDGTAFARLSPFQPLSLVHSADGPRAGASRLPSLFFVQPQGGAIAVNGVWYRGRVLIADLPGGLTVVNWVNLEAYLVSVVGSEAYPSWKPDALKAQAIAARSYALWHRFNPASQWYDLAAGPQYQAYEGIQKEFNTTLQAVSETRGQVLVKNGGVVQALYAATQSLTDTYHNGFGLSQWGAAAMAASGYDYLTILGQFYPGSQLALIPSG